MSPCSGIRVWGSLLAALALTACLTDFSAGEPDAAPACGNGAIEPGEACDGENFAGQSCASEGFTGGELRCTAGCGLVLTGCTGGCGNGVVEDAEACDDATANSDETPNACRTDCVLAFCGDGVADATELCDGAALRAESCEGLGLGGGELACGLDCDAYDVSGCDRPSLCGNGMIDPGEVCDGSELDGVGCVDRGYLGGTLACAPDCLGLDEAACLRADGEPCLQDDQCDGGLCLDETFNGFPGGLCTRACSSGDCDPWVCAQHLWSVSHCAKPCAQSSECRSGYSCFGANITGVEHCAPHCEADADCPTTLVCNPWTNRCGDPVAGAENGASCVNGDPCRSSFCAFEFLDGYCASPCALSTGICPGDDECSDVFGGIAADMGLCLKSCLVQSDCQRTGYSCEVNPYGNGSVCISP